MNKQDNNFLDIVSAGLSEPDDDERECPYGQWDCPHYQHDKCGVDECIYKEGMG